MIRLFINTKQMDKIIILIIKVKYTTKTIYLVDLIKNIFPYPSSIFLFKKIGGFTIIRFI
nr:hypothetical protein [Mucilaginibacter sp. X5P1]